VKQKDIAIGIAGIGIAAGILIWSKRPTVSFTPNVISPGESTIINWRNFTDGFPITLTLYSPYAEMGSVTVSEGTGHIELHDYETAGLEPGRYSIIAEQPWSKKSARAYLTVL